jgi:PiT family inorganic phosphate transporter
MQSVNSDTLFYVVVATALAFDFTNGFHDTANAMATSVATGALRPRVAVTLSALLNVAGAFLSLKVATTIAKGIVETNLITLDILFAALVGAILWNLVTWAMGLPSSSSHALIGGVIGATWVAAGFDAVQWHGILQKVVIPALFAPLVAGSVAMLGTFVSYRLTQRYRSMREDALDPVDRRYRRGQVISASLLSLAHGTNDAQKTMGIITLALVAHGNLPAEGFSVPTWVIIAAAAAIGLGTYTGGWRIIRTLGHRVTDIQPPQGLSADSTSATVILAATSFGYPLSTTHVASGSVIGSGIGRRLAEVRWGIAGRMAIAWLLTLPAAAAVAALVNELSDRLGADSTGPIVIAVLAIAGAAGLVALARRNPITADNVNASEPLPALAAAGGDAPVRGAIARERSVA